MEIRCDAWVAAQRLDEVGRPAFEQDYQYVRTLGLQDMDCRIAFHLMCLFGYGLCRLEVHVVEMRVVVDLAHVGVVFGEVIHRIDGHDVDNLIIAEIS